MTYLESYEMLNRMARAFKIGDNAKTVQSRTASIANNSNLEPNKHAMKVNEIVKDIQRVGSTRFNHYKED